MFLVDCHVAAEDAQTILTDPYVRTVNSFCVKCVLVQLFDKVLQQTTLMSVYLPLSHKHGQRQSGCPPRIGEVESKVPRGTRADRSNAWDWHESSGAATAARNAQGASLHQKTITAEVQEPVYVWRPQSILTQSWKRLDRIQAVPTNIDRSSFVLSWGLKRLDLWWWKL